MTACYLLYLNPLSGQETEEEQTLSWRQNLNIQLTFHLVHHSRIFSSESRWWVLSNRVEGKEQEEPSHCDTENGLRVEHMKSQPYCGAVIGD